MIESALLNPASADSLPAATWDTELLLLHAPNRAALAGTANRLAAHLEQHPDISLADLAFTLNTRPVPPQSSRLAIVAGSIAETRTRLARSQERLADSQCQEIRDTTGIYFAAQPLRALGQIAFLFPGEGAQYPGMLRDIVAAFPEAADFLSRIDAGLSGVRAGEPPVSQLFLTRGNTEAEAALRRLDNAMLAVLMADGALHRVLTRLGLAAEYIAGHSIGESAALFAADSLQLEEGFVHRFGTIMRDLQQREESSDLQCVLLAVGAGTQAVGELLAAAGEPPVYIAMDNCPHQTVLVGRASDMTAVQEALRQRGLVCERLGLHRPYHTPLFEPMLGPLRELYAGLDFPPPRVPVFSCATCEPFPADGDAIRDLLVQSWARPLRFTRTVEALYEAGVRLFVEVGPGGHLSSFVQDTLRGRRFVAVPANVSRRSGLTQLNHLLAQLAAHHVPLDLAALYAQRRPRRLDLAVLEAAPPTGSRTVVLKRYFEVMQQFLDVQREVTQAYLGRCPRPGRPRAPKRDATTAATPTNRPLRGEIVRLVHGREIILRRVLDRSEDLFADEHTVGGREISRVDPHQHGVPVVPMTFTLAMLAEAAAALVEGKVVRGIRAAQFFRWLAYDSEHPTTVEVIARREQGTAAEEILVRAELRDLGPAGEPSPSGRVVAQGIVVLADQYAPAPEPAEFDSTNLRPLTRSPEQVYHNLFHGPLFQGVRSTLRTGENCIEALVEVPRRAGLFRSIREPLFPFDPVLLDVVLHPLAAWHLEQPDLAGRIMLPVGLACAEFYGPSAAEGSRFLSRAWVRETTVRAFSHQGEILREDGTVYLRLDGLQCWRFYVPFGEVNFHGPKDRYFLSRRWTAMESGSGTAPRAGFALARLEVPRDLKQSAMSRVAAQMTLTPQEMGEFRKRTRAEDPDFVYLFDRIAAKDAIRLRWHDQCGERLFPADIECTWDAAGRYIAHRRGKPDEALGCAVVTRCGELIAALSASGPHIALHIRARQEENTTSTVQEEGLATFSRHTDGGLVAITPTGEMWHAYEACDDEYVLTWTLGEAAS